MCRRLLYFVADSLFPRNYRKQALEMSRVTRHKRYFASLPLLFFNNRVLLLVIILTIAKIRILRACISILSWRQEKKELQQKQKVPHLLFGCAQGTFPYKTSCLAREDKARAVEIHPTHPNQALWSIVANIANKWAKIELWLKMLS